MKYSLPDAVRRCWNGETPPEKAIIEWAISICPQEKKLLDIGAHIGSWTLPFAETGRSVVAFEAQSLSFYHLCQGVSDNGFQDRVLAIHTALGAEEGIADLRIVSEDGGGSSTLSLSTHGPDHVIKVEKIGRRRLDSFFDEADLRNVGLIKIDVEGAEDVVLQGGTETLRKNGYPPIVFESWRDSRMPEASDLRAKVFATLHQIGYYSIKELALCDEMFLAIHLHEGNA